MSNEADEVKHDESNETAHSAAATPTVNCANETTARTSGQQIGEPSSNINNTFEVNLSNLLAMGFSEDKARSVLRLKSNNFELALNEMLGIGIGAGDLLPHIAVGDLSSEGILEKKKDHAIVFDNSKTDGIKVVHCALSQYDIVLPASDSSSVYTGRSACSCIAIFGAISFFSNFTPHKTNCDVEDIITPDFIQNLVLAGVDIYAEATQLQQQNKFSGNATYSTPEHFSPEEVLESVSWLSSDLEQIGEIRQGLLSSGDTVESGNQLNGNTSSFYSQLLSCRNDAKARGSEWMAVIVTKTPETVLVLLPPLITTHSENKYILIDSHPRTQFSASGSYAILHPSLESLVYSLSLIFPATDLGPDVGDFASMMYNSFDLYSFQAKSF